MPQYLQTPLHVWNINSSKLRYALTGLVKDKLSLHIRKGRSTPTLFLILLKIPVSTVVFNAAYLFPYCSSLVFLFKIAIA